MNNWFGIGRLTRDPELKYSPQGTAVCNFTLAVNRRFKRDTADFIDVVCWKALAENCANYLTKGSQAAVSGELQIRTYETKDGQKRKVAEIIADQVQFLDSKKDAPKSRSMEDDFSDLGRQVDIADDQDIPW